jgi:hypothetical protein
MNPVLAIVCIFAYDQVTLNKLLFLNIWIIYEYESETK